MFLVAAASRHVQSLLALLAFVAIDASALGLTHAQGEHPFVSGAIKRCDGLTARQCAQAKQARIARIGGTIRDCERGVLHSCNILLQLRDLSDAARAHVEQVRARLVARGEDNPATQILRRNTTEAPPGAYRVPQIEARSGIPPGVHSGLPPGVSPGIPPGVSSGSPGVFSGLPPGVSPGVPEGVSPGVPQGVSPDIPKNVRPAVPDNVSSGSGGATARVPENVTSRKAARSSTPAHSATPAHSGTPATAAVPNGVSPGVPPGVSSGSPAKGGVPDNVRIGTTAKSATPVQVSTASSKGEDKTATSPAASEGWHSIAPTKSDATTSPAKSPTAEAGTGWKSMPPAGQSVASVDASKANGASEISYRQSAVPVPITEKVATDVLPYAVLARDVDTKGSSEALFGFKSVGDDWQKIMLQNGVSEPDVKRFEAAGFYGRVYRNEKTGEVVVAYPPSTALLSNPLSQDWKNDWGKTNLPQLAGPTTAQYEAAMKLAEATRSKYGNAPLTLTGFSKGGGQASYAGSLSDKVVTFSAARNPDAVGGYNRNQTNVIVPGDSIGDPHGTLPAGVGSLPGTTVAVSSSEPRLVKDIKLGTEKHAIDGMLGGLLDAAGGKYRASPP